MNSFRYSEDLLFLNTAFFFFLIIGLFLISFLLYKKRWIIACLLLLAWSIVLLFLFRLSSLYEVVNIHAGKSGVVQCSGFYQIKDSAGVIRADVKLHRGQSIPSDMIVVLESYDDSIYRLFAMTLDPVSVRITKGEGVVVH